MVKNRSKPNGLSDRSKDKIAGRITEVVVQNLKTNFDRLSKNSAAGRFDSDDSILDAFPEYQHIVEYVAQMNWASRKFSREHVELAIRSIVVKIVRNSEPTTFEENASECVQQMVVELASFANESAVYVPLEGLTLGQGLPSLRFENANLVRVDEAMISELLRSVHKDETEEDVDLETLAEAQENLYPFHRLLEELEELQAQPTQLSPQTRLFEGPEDSKETEQEKLMHSRYFEFLKQVMAEVESVDQRSHLHGIASYFDRPNRTNLPYLFNMLQRGVDRRPNLRELENELRGFLDKRESRIRTLTEQIYDKKSAVERRREPIDSLKGTVCARYSYEADAKKALEYAQQDAASLADLLRYALSVAQAKEKGPLKGLQGEIAHGHRTMVAIASDGSEIEVAKSAAVPYLPFEINQQHLGIFREAGIFEIARILSQNGKLPGIEGMLKRCINWFSLSKMQVDQSSEFLSLVIILEILLTPSKDASASISASIADGAAILIADSEPDRKEKRKLTKDLYDTRSDIAHGSLTNIENFEKKLVDLRNIVINLITVVLKLKKEGKLKKNATKENLLNLINSTKFQGPPILK